MVLSHLILNDMMKVKGHIARLALCLQDDDPRIAGLAQVFFHELSRKAFKVRRCRTSHATGHLDIVVMIMTARLAPLPPSSILQCQLIRQALLGHVP